MGIDGSKLRLPNSEATVNEFGVTTGKEGSRECPMALASVYYDVLNNLTIDRSINSTRGSERECAASHLELAQPDDLSILDRCYNAFGSTPYMMRLSAISACVVK
jgi:hypothetical protein